MEKYKCFLGTTRENCCSLSTQNIKDKQQSGVCTKSARRRFQTQEICYLERHLTTQPHETFEALVAVEDEEWDDVIQCRFDIRPQNIVNPRKHNRLVHPCVFLAARAVGCRLCCKLHLCNATIWLPLKNHHQWEHHTIGSDCHHHSFPLVVVH
jgi:hypothetical protein